jgi:hypothetical protein
LLFLLKILTLEFFRPVNGIVLFINMFHYQLMALSNEISKEYENIMLIPLVQIFIKSHSEIAFYEFTHLLTDVNGFTISEILLPS